MHRLVPALLAIITVALIIQIGTSTTIKCLNEPLIIKKLDLETQKLSYENHILENTIKSLEETENLQKKYNDLLKDLQNSENQKNDNDHQLRL